MNILITGGAGFTGSNLIPHLLRQASADPQPAIHKLVNYDRLTQAGNADNLADCETDARYHFVHADIGDRPSLSKTLTLHEIDAVIHLAEESCASRSIESPDLFVATNLTGTFQLLEACRTHCRSQKKDFRLIHVSSGKIHGSLDSSAPPFRESSALAPTSPYAATKAGASLLVRAYALTYGFAALSVTVSDSYGPFQSPNHLIPLAIRRIAAGRPVPLHGDGSQTRDWIYVEDVCRGLVLALLHGQPGETYHLSAHNEQQNIQVVRQLIAIVQALHPGCPQIPLDDLITFVADRPANHRRCALDSTKIRQELGWQPHEGFDTGLRKTVQWYLDNEDWIETMEAKRAAGGQASIPPGTGTV